MYTEIKAKLNAALEHNIATRDASLNKEDLYDRYAHELEWAEHICGIWPCVKLLSNVVEELRSAGIVTSPGYGYLTSSFLFYLAGVTQVNPVEWDIPFSRFLTSFIFGRELKLETGTGGIEVVENVLKMRSKEIIRIESGLFQITFYEGNSQASYLLHIIEYPELDRFKSTLQEGWHRLDEATLRLFRNGNTDGSIWFESDKMREWLIDFCPDCMSDLVLLRTLYYPRRIELFPEVLRRKKASSEIPSTGDEEADNVLRETYGILVYQEQVCLLQSVNFLPPSAIDRMNFWIKQIRHKQLSPVEIPFNSTALKGHEVARTMLSVEALWNRTHLPWECGKGWLPLIEKVVAEIDLYNTGHPQSPIEVSQIKQKSGGLRICHYNAPVEIMQLIDEAVAAAWHTCERCGSTTGVTTNTDGYRLTLCPECRKEIKPRVITKRKIIVK